MWSFARQLKLPTLLFRVDVPSSRAFSTTLRDSCKHGGIGAAMLQTRPVAAFHQHRQMFLLGPVSVFAEIQHIDATVCVSFVSGSLGLPGASVAYFGVMLLSLGSRCSGVLLVALTCRYYACLWLVLSGDVCTWAWFRLPCVECVTKRRDG